MSIAKGNYTDPMRSKVKRNWRSPEGESYSQLRSNRL